MLSVHENKTIFHTVSQIFYFYFAGRGGPPRGGRGGRGGGKPGGFKGGKQVIIEPHRYASYIFNFSTIF